MKDYQRKKGKYILPTAVYNRVLWQIRDYYRLVAEYNSIPGEGRSISDNDGQPHGSPRHDTMDRKIIRMDALKKQIGIIEEELEKIPSDYQEGVWNNILYGTRYPHDADRSTYGRYKSRMIYNIAERQGLIEY